MKNIDIAKRNYDAGYWTKGNLRALVAKGRLTQDEMDSVTGEATSAAATTTEPVFRLNPSTSTYHWPGCNLAGDNTLSLTLDQVAEEAGDKAKACTRCVPPAIATAAQ